MKRFLLDTHLLYWWMTADKQLGKASEKIIANSEITISTASIWEMVLKHAKGKLPLPKGELAGQLEEQGFILLPVFPRHIEVLKHLACKHTDPFDRLLIAQAQNERMSLLTRDAAILALGLNCVVAG